MWWMLLAFVAGFVTAIVLVVVAAFTEDADYPFPPSAIAEMRYQQQREAAYRAKFGGGTPDGQKAASR